MEGGITLFVSLWHYLKGYVIVEVCGGNIEKLLNLMTYHGIEIWQLKHKETGVFFCMAAADFKKIKGDVRRAKCRLRITYKSGVPFITNKYKKRHLFVAGVFAFVILLWVLTSYVWLVDVEGNERISGMEIMHTLESYGYKTGKLKRQMDLRQAETVLIEQYPELVWVGIHYEGTRMVVKVSESVLPPEMLPLETSPKALCAKRDALITYIAVEKGKPMVKAGDIVKKGDMLVQGEMPLGEEDPTLYYTSAKADVKGKTVYHVRSEMSLVQIKKDYTLETSKKYCLHFFDKKWTFYSQKPLQGDYDIQHSLSQLQITRLFPLPFGIDKVTQVGYRAKSFEIAEEEAKDLLLASLWKDISSQLGEEAIVLKREAFFKTCEGKVIGDLYIIAEEKIDFEVDIEQKMINEGEKINESN